MHTTRRQTQDTAKPAFAKFGAGMLIWLLADTMTTKVRTTEAVSSTPVGLYWCPITPYRLPPLINNARCCGAFAWWWAIQQPAR